MFFDSQLVKEESSASVDENGQGTPATIIPMLKTAQLAAGAVRNLSDAVKSALLNDLAARILAQK